MRRLGYQSASELELVMNFRIIHHRATLKIAAGSRALEVHRAIVERLYSYWLSEAACS